MDLGTAEINEAFKTIERLQLEKSKVNMEEIKCIKKNFKIVCDRTKREHEKVTNERSVKKRTGVTRSGKKRGEVKQLVYSDGRHVNKGIDDAQDKPFDEDEQNHLKREISKIKEVKDLKTHHTRYIILNVILDELKDIQAEKVESNFHDKFKALKGKNKSDLFSEVRTSLFTNEQKDYINGLLQGAFKTTIRDEKGNIKHSDIDYVRIVMLAEATIRIVKYVHKFKSNDAAFAFMIKKSREAHGIELEDCDQSY